MARSFSRIIIVSSGNPDILKVFNWQIPDTIRIPAKIPARDLEVGIFAGMRIVSGIYTYSECK